MPIRSPIGWDNLVIKLSLFREKVSPQQFDILSPQTIVEAVEITTNSQNERTFNSIPTIVLSTDAPTEGAPSFETNQQRYQPIGERKNRDCGEAWSKICSGDAALRASYRRFIAVEGTFFQKIRN